MLQGERGGGLERFGVIERGNARARSWRTSAAFVAISWGS
jgi:hypothetical protein